MSSTVTVPDKATEVGHEPYLRFLLFAILAIVLVLPNVDTMWTISPDLAFHYSLTFRLGEQFGLPVQDDPTLSFMSYYPPGSHIIGTIVGIFLHSSILGLQVVTLLSLSLVWMSLFLILLTFRDGRALPSVLAFTFIVIINSLFLHFDLHGSEIVVNFFYSQLVAQSILYFSVFAAIQIERYYGTIYAIIFMTLTAMVNAYMHLLPSLEMLGTMVGTSIVFISSCILDKSRNSLLRSVIASAICIVGVLGIVLHPSFSVMQKLAAWDGGLNLTNIVYPTGVLFLCLVVIISSATLFVIWTRSEEKNVAIALRYLAILGGVTAVLCGVQFILHLYGHGSDYSVKKYGFALMTILLLQISVLIGGFLRSHKLFRGSNIVSYPAMTVWTGLAIVATILTITTNNQKILDVGNLVRLERQLINIKDTTIPDSDGGVEDVAIGLPDANNIVNFMFSIAILHATHEVVGADVYGRDDILDPLRYRYIISARSNQDFGALACESMSNGSLSVVSGACVSKRKIKYADCATGFDFSQSGLVPNDLLQGFSWPEVHGRWTDGHTASFECHRSADTIFSTLRIELFAFVYGEVKTQRIDLKLNGTRLGSYNLDGDAQEIVIPIPPSINEDRLMLEFEMPDAISPQEVGLNQDLRKLGIALKRLTFE